MADENSMVVVVDTNRPKMTECEELLKKTKTIVVLDHHRQSSDNIENAMLSYIEPYASSTCEMIAEVLQYFKENIKLEPSEADSIYAGILIDMSAYKARAEVVRHAEVYKGSFAISVCPGKMESPTIVGAQAADELLNIIGIKASFVLTEYKGKIFISSRSIDEINVQIIMERLGGGGHLNMAGAQLTGHTLPEAKRVLQDTIDKMLEEGAIEI